MSIFVPLQDQFKKLPLFNTLSPAECQPRRPRILYRNNAGFLSATGTMLEPRNTKRSRAIFAFFAPSRETAFGGSEWQEKTGLKSSRA